MNPAALIDVARYPLETPASAAYAAAVTLAQTGLRAAGAAELPGFLSTTGLEACVADAERLGEKAFWSEGQGSAYLEASGAAWPADHPRAQRMPFRVGVVAYDQFPVHSPLRQLYEWPPLLEFIRTVLGTRQLFHYADPLGALNLAVMGDGDVLQWHYDQTDFVVSLALRPAAVGGHFEVAPRLRSDHDECYSDVASVLNGTSSLVEVLALHAATLLLFEGRHSLHRVSPIVGAPSRLVALLGFDNAPGTCSTPELQLKRYGRVVPTRP